MTQAAFAIRGRNPDVLTCIANLSNDEVFTPPEFANQMLDTLASAWAEANDGANIWADPTVTFLDPFTKSGVFLREITVRLIDGLETQIPDLRERVDHILTKQVFGIAITSLTALLARRSLYCSKFANGKHSVASSFETENGNIWFERTEHTWIGRRTERQAHPTENRGITVEIEGTGRCQYCGASEAEYGRGDALESYAYAFIHTNDITARIAELFGEDMHFDVIVGNPPYQLSDGGGAGSSAMPLYHRFVEQAKALEPRFLTMVIPSKWFSGGKGLDTFRATMLSDNRIRAIVDYPNSREAFGGVDVAGGVMYFLRARDQAGTCVVETREGGNVYLSERRLDEYEMFVRDNRVLEVVKKVQGVSPAALSAVVSARRPFGIDSSYVGKSVGDLYLYSSGGDGRIDRSDVAKGLDLVDEWKVLVSKTSSEHAGQTDSSGRKRVLSRIEVMPPGSVATESYLIVGPFRSELEAKRAADYLRTRFVRFLVSAILLTQNITRSSFTFVPYEDFSGSNELTDDYLFAKYDLDDEQVAYVQATIRSMSRADDQEP